jgi:vesicle coat complex subunit
LFEECNFDVEVELLKLILCVESPSIKAIAFVNIILCDEELAREFVTDRIQRVKQNQLFATSEDDVFGYFNS